MEWNPVFGDTKFRKGGMDTFSKGFGRNQIKAYINRRIEKKMKKIKAQCNCNQENMEYNYHFESDTYSDDDN